MRKQEGEGEREMDGRSNWTQKHIYRNVDCERRAGGGKCSCGKVGKFNMFVMNQFQPSSLGFVSYLPLLFLSTVWSSMQVYMLQSKILLSSNKLLCHFLDLPWQILHEIMCAI